MSHDPSETIFYEIRCAHCGRRSTAIERDGWNQIPVDWFYDVDVPEEDGKTVLIHFACSPACVDALAFPSLPPSLAPEPETKP